MPATGADVMPEMGGLAIGATGAIGAIGVVMMTGAAVPVTVTIVTAV